MPSHRAIVLSTTGAIAGYEIERHIEPVSAQFVIGTGIFADFFSSFSDLFGAGSKSYQNKMDRIEKQALHLIRLRAAQVGANGVIGLRIDHDEISGAGKSMMMVSVAGTAVRVKEVVPQQQRKREVDGAVTPEQLSEDLEIRRFVADKSEDRATFNQEDWDYVCDHPRTELAGLVLEHSTEPIYAGSGTEPASKALDHATDYFSSLSPEDAQRLLFSAVGDPEKAGGSAAAILVRLQLVDLALLQEVLASDDKVVRTRAVYIAQGHPPLYEPDDLERLAAIVETLRSEYREVVEWKEKKQLVGSRRIWVCPCGHENPEEAPICGNCRSNHFGLYKIDRKPPEIAVMLSERLEVLDSRLSSELQEVAD